MDDIPDLLAQSVGHKLELLNRRAKVQSQNEHYNLSLEEVQGELGGWGSSCILPSDWIPLTALQTKQLPSIAHGAYLSGQELGVLVGS